MLASGDSAVVGSSGEVAAPTATTVGPHDGGGAACEVGSNSGEDDKGRADDGDRSFGGNRWPRQETLALLKIRSDMDQVFRDSSLKGPLWEEVSRKLAELGYHRSAKKCKEKFENVYKYHKRTKDGRTGKPEGKHYKFFDQLQALDHHSYHSLNPPLPPPKPQSTPMQTNASTTTPATMPWTTNPIAQNIQVITAPATNPTMIPATQATHITNITSFPSSIPASFPNISSSNLFSSSTSSSTASDEEYPEGGVRNKRKRKWKVFFKRLTKEVMRKQEELQDKFLETIEKREHERLVREEAWRIQEMTRINREHEILIQERSTAAAKDAAVIAFLQKISGQQQPQNPVQLTRDNPQPPAANTTSLELAARPQQTPPLPPPTTVMNVNITTPKPANGETGFVLSTSSRWPKAEVEALIKFRTDLALKYQENGPKGPLWEEISAAMRSVGYNRNAKRCKEKWENINKYFKKVKESNRKRSEDSKTCPYFSQLDALYKEKMKPVNNPMEPLMVQPEQQWPLVQEDMERDNTDQIQDDEEGEDVETEDEYEGGGGYEIVANKAAASMGTEE